MRAFGHAGFPGEESRSASSSLFPASGRESMPTTPQRSLQPSPLAPRYPSKNGLVRPPLMAGGGIASKRTFPCERWAIPKPARLALAQLPRTNPHHRCECDDPCHGGLPCGVGIRRRHGDMTGRSLKSRGTRNRVIRPKRPGTRYHVPGARPDRVPPSCAAAESPPPRQDSRCTPGDKRCTRSAYWRLLG